MGIEVLRYDKRAQFYLLASVIVVILIVGLLSITNYSTKNDNPFVKNFGEEFEMESEKVIDYSVLNNEDRLENFTAEYSTYLGNRADAYFIKGDEGDMEAYQYANGIKTDLTSYVTISGDKINFEIDDTTYEFDLNKGQNFYFILLKEVDGEKYVYTN